MDEHLHPDILRSHGILELPQRPQWDTDSILEPESVSALEAATSMTGKWNRWADQVEEIYRIMHQHSEELNLDDDDYIALIGIFSHHPARPEFVPGETFENRPEDEDLDFPRIPLFELYKRWDDYADVLVRTFREFARALSGRSIRTGGVQEMMEWGDGDLDLSKLSLTAGVSTASSLRAILGHMLGPGHSFHAPSNYEAEQLPDFGSVAEGETDGNADNNTDSDSMEGVRIVDLTLEDSDTGDQETKDQGTDIQENAVGDRMQGVDVVDLTLDDDDDDDETEGQETENQEIWTQEMEDQEKEDTIMEGLISVEERVWLNSL